MEKINKKSVLSRLVFGVAALFAVALIVPGSASAQERVRPFGTGIENLWTDQTINDNTDGEDNASSTMDLHFGDISTCDFMVSVASGATGGTANLSFQVQGSPNSGTDWIHVSSFTSITVTTATEAVKQSVNVGPGNTVRVIPVLSSDTTFYSIDMWGRCQADR